MNKRGLASLIVIIFTLLMFSTPVWAAEPAIPEGFLDYGSDTNKNGVFDHLSVDVTIKVNEPGKYRIAGEILARKNLKEFESIAYTSFMANLAGGSQLVTIHFPGGDILNKKKDGPFFLNVKISKGSWSKGGYLGETRIFKAVDFEDADEILTYGKVTRKSQAIALVEAKAKELNLNLGSFKSLVFNGEWKLSYTNPGAQEPFEFVIDDAGVVTFLGQVAAPSQAENEPPTPQPDPEADPEPVTPAQPEPAEPGEKSEVKEADSVEKPVKEEAPSEPRSEKNGKLDDPGNISVWPFMLFGFIFFLLLGVAAEIKAKYR